MRRRRAACKSKRAASSGGGEEEEEDQEEEEEAAASLGRRPEKVRKKERPRDKETTGKKRESKEESGEREEEEAAAASEFRAYTRTRARLCIMYAFCTSLVQVGKREGVYLNNYLIFAIRCERGKRKRERERTEGLRKEARAEFQCRRRVTRVCLRGKMNSFEKSVVKSFVRFILGV